MESAQHEECFDIVDAVTGVPTGEVAPRSVVHSRGLYHRAVHVWLLVPSTGELLLQRRARCKDSWPGALDISCAGHVSAGDAPLPSAVRELAEELGLAVPTSRLEWLFTHLERLESVQRGRLFINNEFNDVFLLTLTPEERRALNPSTVILRDVSDSGDAGSRAVPPPFSSGFALQRSEVEAVEWRAWQEVEGMYAGVDCSSGGDRGGDDHGDRIVPTSDAASYLRLFRECEKRMPVA